VQSSCGVKAKLARLLIDVLIDNDDDGTNNDNFPSIHSIMAALMRLSLFAQTRASEMYLLLLLHFAHITHENCPIANVRFDLKSASKQMNNLFQRVSVTFVFVCAHLLTIRIQTLEYETRTRASELVK